MDFSIVDRLISWWGLFKSGGPLMYPIFICSLAALTIILERLWMLRRKNIFDEELLNKAYSLVEKGKYDEALNVLQSSNTSMARVAIEGISKRHRPRWEIKEAMEDAGKREGYLLGQFVSMLGGIAGLAPLLGFLGTVYGMIVSFNVIAQEGVGRAGDVAGGIAMALLTTAAGLTVAVPSFIGYRYFVAKIDNLLGEMEESSLKLLDLLTEQKEVGGKE